MTDKKMANLIEIKVPDVGNVPSIDVVEVLISIGELIVLDQTVATLETDKATMELPSPVQGRIEQIFIKAGDKVQEGTLVATVVPTEIDNTSQTTVVAEVLAPVTEQVQAVNTPSLVTSSPAQQSVNSNQHSVSVPIDATTMARKAHASPAVRLFARELGVDINTVSLGSGRKGRLLKEDIKEWVKKIMLDGKPVSAAAIPAIPVIDFSVFGEIEAKSLSKIKKLTGQNLTRVWLNLPMVTYHDEADITDLEAFRSTLNAEKGKDELKITGLLFIIKALVAAMQQFPSFNASLSSDGEQLLLKKYFNIGIAVDTPNGLVVPVLRDVNNKSINQLALELAEKSTKARQGKLLPADMQGGCMTISSLGGIGGTAFTPIVNAPEVAILGVTRAKMQPVWNGSEFVPRLMLPLDLTYDHRVIDGAEGARFMSVVIQNLSDIRRLLL
jgi:pyruvate dehydrogenase E2 component (dihydrolipoamide acetyltransferase)